MHNLNTSAYLTTQKMIILFSIKSHRFKQVTKCLLVSVSLCLVCLLVCYCQLFNASVCSPVFVFTFSYYCAVVDSAKNSLAFAVHSMQIAQPPMLLHFWDRPQPVNHNVLHFLTTISYFQCFQKPTIHFFTPRFNGKYFK